MIFFAPAFILITALWSSVPDSAQADVVVPVRPIRAHMTISAADIVQRNESVEGAFTELGPVVGLEAKVTLYPGRPILLNDVGPPAIVERNQSVTMVYSKFGLRIQTEGRAMQRGGVGERIRVMNADSRNIVNGVINESGEIEVGN